MKRVWVAVSSRVKLHKTGWFLCDAYLCLFSLLCVGGNGGNRSSLFFSLFKLNSISRSVLS